MSDSAADSFGKVVLGGVVGFALYMLVTGLGLGTGRGADRGEGEAAGPPTPSPPAPTPPRPPTLRDKERLSFVMTEPTQPPTTRPAVFELRGDPTRTYTLLELIGRVRSGGRSDVTLRVRGDVLQGPADAARKMLAQAKIQVWEETSSGDEKPRPPLVSGNARGEYGRRIR